MTSVVTTKDNVEYSSDSMELFENGGILDTKVVIQVSLRLSYDLEEASIWVRLSDSQSTRDTSFVEVEGNDSTWVNGTFSKLTECTNSWEKQDAILKRFRWPISFFAAIITAFSLVWLLTIPLRGTKQADSALASVSAFVFPVSIVVILLWLSDFLDKLWPNIEIVPVPEHERKLDKKRKYLWGIISLILIPVVIAVVQWFLSRT